VSIDLYLVHMDGHTGVHDEYAATGGGVLPFTECAGDAASHVSPHVSHLYVLCMCVCVCVSVSE